MYIHQQQLYIEKLWEEGRGHNMRYKTWYLIWQWQPYLSIECIWEEGEGGQIRGTRPDTWYDIDNPIFNWTTLGGRGRRSNKRYKTWYLIWQWQPYLSIECIWEEGDGGQIRGTRPDTWYDNDNNIYQSYEFGRKGTEVNYLVQDLIPDMTLTPIFINCMTLGGRGRRSNKRYKTWYLIWHWQPYFQLNDFGR